MKKIVAIVLTLALTLCAAGALAAEPTVIAETASGFDVRLVVPEGVESESEMFDQDSYVFLTIADGPDLVLSIAPSEEYHGVSMSELSDEEIAALAEVLTADLDEPNYTVETSANGYKYILVDDESEFDAAILSTVYGGYFIQMMAVNDEHAVLSDDDIAFVKGVFDTLEIVPVESAN